MSDVSSKQGRIEELLRKSLLGEELVNTQFHVFSARSRSAGRVLKPRVLCANNVLLAKGSTYFLDLFSSDVDVTDSSLIDLVDDHDVPCDALIDVYGYGSDSDLDECDGAVPASTPEGSKDHAASRDDDDEQSDDGSVSSDMFVMSPEQPSTGDNEPFAALKGSARSEGSSVTAVQDAAGHGTSSSRNQTVMRLRSLGSRHVLVKDTAFQTWYTLLNYLYTDKCSFLPLSSAVSGGHPLESSTSSLDEPRCSAKSMYRLASKVGLDDLRNQALSYIRSSLTEHNILKELSCSLVSTHPELLEMALDVLYTHIGAAPVVAGFPALARRIANKALPHGADIIVGIHTRLLKASRVSPMMEARPLLDGLAVEPEPEPGQGQGAGGANETSGRISEAEEEEEVKIGTQPAPRPVKGVPKGSASASANGLFGVSTPAKPTLASTGWKSWGASSAFATSTGGVSGTLDRAAMGASVSATTNAAPDPDPPANCATMSRSASPIDDGFSFRRPIPAASKKKKRCHPVPSK